MDSEHQSSLDSSLGRTESEDDSDEDTLAFSTMDEDKKSQQKAKAKSWNLAETLISPFTATMNILNCGQIVSGEAAGDVDALENHGKMKSMRYYDDNNKNNKQERRSRQPSAVVESRDDTFDDETTAYSYEQDKKRSAYRDRDFASSYSECSSRSDLSDDSEGDIKVRSSIRETMESIVSKSKSGYRRGRQHEEKSWRSYEAKPKTKRQSSTSSRRQQSNNIPTSPKIPPRSLSRGNRRSFFNRNKGR